MLADNFQLKYILTCCVVVHRNYDLFVFLCCTIIHLDLHCVTHQSRQSLANVTDTYGPWEPCLSLLIYIVSSICILVYLTISCQTYILVITYMTSTVSCDYPNLLVSFYF